MSVEILIGDVMDKLAGLPDESVQCCVTSPPYYGLRCYDAEGQIGLEATPEAHIARLVEVFREVRRVLRADGVLWLNYGDAYAGGGNGGGGSFAQDGIRAAKPGTDKNVAARKGSGAVGNAAKPKDLLMLPARVALALQADGWWLRSALPWVKRSAMPESVTDRPATAIEYVFLLTKSARYFYDAEAVRRASNGVWNWAKRFSATGKRGAVDYEGRGRNQFDGPKSHPDIEQSGRNFRNSDLFYASLAPPHGLICGADGRPLALDVNPAGFAEAHFATFPPKLIEPLIKAGSSEKGCCPACGAPWVRAVEVFGGIIGESWHDHKHDSTQGAKPNPGKLARGWDTHGYSRKTLGWSPSCECKRTDGPASVPCTVLDPFGGAGTTGLVADRLGRDAVLIELNPDYAAMTRKRIDTDAATRGAGPAPVMRGDDLPLFQDSGIRDQASILRQAQEEGDQESDGGLSSEALAKEEP